jgi:hypothetical protein
MAIDVRFRWGRLSNMPKCEHGKIEGYCSKCPDSTAALRALATKERGDG